MRKLSIDTLAIQAGENPDDSASAAMRLPLEMSTSFKMPEFGPELFDTMFLSSDRPKHHTYTRWTNPTLRAFEDRIAALEEGEAGLAFAGGMAAISGLATTLLSQGDHVIISDVCYMGALELFGMHLPRFGIQVSRVNTSDPQAVQEAMRSNTKLIYVETPSNPILRISDIQLLAEIAHAWGVALVVDSTFAGPTLQRPLDLGADFVIHSATKYLCGHGDALGGVIVGSKGALHKVRLDGLIHFGGALSPFNAWLIMRGMMTLPLRMERHCSNTLKIARFLETHPAVRKVIYPGLESHPHYALAQRQMPNGCGGVLSMILKGGIGTAVALAEKIRVFSFATSLGHLRSMLYYYPTETFTAPPPPLGPAQHADLVDWMGKEGVIRINVGLEDADDLIADLDQALKGRSFKSMLAPLAYRMLVKEHAKGGESDFSPGER